MKVSFHSNLTSLSDESALIRAAGYAHTLIYQPNHAWFNIALDQDAHYRVFCRCSWQYPIEPPQLIIAEKDSGRFEQWFQIDLAIPSLEQWGANAHLLDVVNEVQFLLIRGAYSATNQSLAELLAIQPDPVPLQDDLVPWELEPEEIADTISDEEVTASLAQLVTEPPATSSVSAPLTKPPQRKHHRRFFRRMMTAIVFLLAVWFAFDLWRDRTDETSSTSLPPTPPRRPTSTSLVAPEREVSTSTPVTTMPEPSPQIYIVKRGDTLRSIAKSFYDSESAWTAIRDSNKIEDPDRIYSGQPLIIPPR
jgi:LysM repeat protein